MRSNERLQRVLAIRQLGGARSASTACTAPTSQAAMINDLRLFALTFACGFLFTTIFIA
jgi:hypothetical protein